MSSKDQDSVESRLSLDSSESQEVNIVKGYRARHEDQENNEPAGISLRSYSNIIISRTSTIAEAIRDDNEYATKHESRKIEPAPIDDVVLAPLEKTATAISAIYDGEFNKEDVISKPPDGTFWGWMCVACVMFVNAFSWGANSSYGVFLDYYTKTDHFPGANNDEFALIGGLNLGLSFMVCNLANTLVRRYPYKIVMSAGIVLIVICYFVAAEVTTITQLIMVQGLLLSIGYALVAGPSMLLIPTWFLEKRSLANGTTASGAGLAGLIFSRPVQLLIDQTGSFKWALRMIGIVCGAMLVLSTILMKSRRSLIVNTGLSLWGDIVKNFTRWDIYRQTPMISLITWNFIYGVAYTILLFSLSAYSSSIGLSYKQGSMVTTMQSVAQMVGRPALGYISARYGKANVTILFTLFLGIFSLAFWIFVNSYGALIAYGVIAGFIQGVNWVNFTPMCADVVGGGDDLVAAVSVLCFVGGPPLIVSEIIGLKLERPNSEKPFLYCQILVGVTCIVSAFVLLPFREWKIWRMFDARRHLIERKEERSEEDEIRLRRYEVLLERSVRGYLIRSFYPIKT
ncbi:DEKNAAC104520 [Brettanomyces naardenensis]|uniref:DEKNAAC104520 n=1 Tax=Brettanomyces naardenensis TaxID=13370 RepID=A0A448YRL7_BRENA|nr:DEKNAAC104520 [Brettanomyces naardenensis]